MKFSKFLYVTLVFALGLMAFLPTPASAGTGNGLLIPAGTTFRVRTIDMIDVDATQAGAMFRGSLDDPIMLGGSVIVPRGADVKLVAAKVQQGGKIKGSDLVGAPKRRISASRLRTCCVWQYPQPFRA